MSQFLGAESYLIPLGSTIQQVQATIKAAITAYGWQVVREATMPTNNLGNFTTPGSALEEFPFWGCGDSNALPKWIGVQMPAAFTPTMMYLMADYQGGNFSPKTFTLDWSDDGTTWNTHATWSNEVNWYGYECRKYPVAGAPSKVYWRINVTARNGGSTTIIGKWNLSDASGQWLGNPSWIDFIPPAGEAIGDSRTREVLRLMFKTATIGAMSILESLVDFPQYIRVYGATAGAVTVSLTLNGQTVSYTGSAGYTAHQNLRGLYEAIQASANATFMGWDWGFYRDTIEGFNKTPATAFMPASGTNLTVQQVSGVRHQAMPVPGCHPIPVTVSIDRTNGFVYYLQVNKRGIALGTKTNVGFSTPIHACYGDNAQAIAQIPYTPSQFKVPCSIIELTIGWDDVAANTGGFARPSHWWGISWFDTGSALTDTESDTSNSKGYVCSSHPFTKQCRGNLIQDLATGAQQGAYNNINGNNTFTVRGEGIFTGADPGNGWTVHRMTVDPDTIVQYQINNSNQLRASGPVYTGLDWYRYTGTLLDEQMVVAPHTDFETTITSSLAPGATTVNVADTTGFPAAGYIVIENEVIQYAAKTGTSFTGCTRAMYTTPAETRYSGTLVSIAGWFVKIGQGLIFWGYQKPA